MSIHLHPRRFGRVLFCSIHSRPFSIGRIARTNGAEAVAVPEAVAKQRRPIGGFRGGIFGFLLGFSVASSFASYHLLEEYKLASSLMQASVEELQYSTQKISVHVRRIEAVEKDLKALSESSAEKGDISKLRAEMKKLYDGLHIEFLDLKTHVWGMQQDLHGLLKKEGSSTRV